MWKIRSNDIELFTYSSLLELGILNQLYSQPQMLPFVLNLFSLMGIFLSAKKFMTRVQPVQNKVDNKYDPSSTRPK